jgi:glycosyltransferase involved in cell wall biosynthesis
MKPKLSIITVVYNAEKFIEETINSVISQSYENIEFLIIDGKSKDNTLEIIDKYMNNISILVSEKDSGIYDAMNKGMKLAHGDYVTFLNAGDTYIDKNTLKKIFNQVNDDVDVIYGDYIAILNNKKVDKKAKPFIRENLFKYVTSTVCHQAIFVKRDIYPSYSLSYTLKGELDWYFNILNVKPIISKYIPIPIVFYKRGGLGEQKYILNLNEIIMVLYKYGGIFGLLKGYKFFIKYCIKLIFIITGKYKIEK